MLGGYLEFFMKPVMAETYLNLKRELEDFVQLKVSKAYYSDCYVNPVFWAYYT